MEQTFPRSSKFNVHRVVLYYQEKGGCPSDSITDESNTISWDNSRSGSDLPNWRAIVKAGGDATTNFDGFRRLEVKKVPGEVTVVYDIAPPGFNCNAKIVSYSGDLGTNQGLFDVDDVPAFLLLDKDAILNRAKSIFIRNAKNFISPFEGGVFVGELRETLRMIRSPALAFRQLIDDYFRRLKKVSNRLSSAERRKRLASTYLEFTFGWQPLMADIQGGLEALRRLQKAGPPVGRVTAMNSGKSNGTFPLTDYTAESGFGFKRQGIVDCEYSVRLRGGVSVVSHGMPFGLPETFGIYPDNFLPTAWELIPYSFLIDYFANIGNIIDAWSVVQSRLVYCSYTARQTTSSVWLLSEPFQPDPPPPLFSSVTFSPATSAFSVIRVKRRKLDSVIPTLEFRIPGLLTRQSLNIAALALQASVRRPFY